MPFHNNVFLYFGEFSPALIIATCKQHPRFKSFGNQSTIKTALGRQDCIWGTFLLADLCSGIRSTECH